MSQFVLPISTNETKHMVWGANWFVVPKAGFACPAHKRFALKLGTVYHRAPSGCILCCILTTHSKNADVCPFGTTVCSLCFAPEGFVPNLNDVCVCIHNGRFGFRNKSISDKNGRIVLSRLTCAPLHCYIFVIPLLVCFSLAFLSQHQLDTTVSPRI